MPKPKRFAVSVLSVGRFWESGLAAVKFAGWLKTRFKITGKPSLQTISVPDRFFKKKAKVFFKDGKSNIFTVNRFSVSGITAICLRFICFSGKIRLAAAALSSLLQIERYKFND